MGRYCLGCGQDFGVKKARKRCDTCKQRLRDSCVNTATSKITAERYRDSHLRAMYGIGEFEYQELLVRQGGRCAICRQDNPSGRRLVIDHDHHSGQVRGLLCDHCNTGLGMFHDSPQRMNAAIQYLSRAAKSKVS